MIEEMGGRTVEKKGDVSDGERKGNKETKATIEQRIKKCLVDVFGMTRGAGGETYGDM